ncbi:MAG: OsmC family protein [Flavobacteriaceae bacterium]|nr:OsmC family protein [Flavobacteriaceae bacterium]
MEGNMLFHAESVGGSLKIDTDAANGGSGQGLRPKALMLTALAGCTGLDVVSLFKKMRIEVEGIEIDVQADLTEEHPTYYNKVKVIYKFYGKDFENEKIEKAVKLSQEKYCGVSEMFRRFSELSYEILYFENKKNMSN